MVHSLRNHLPYIHNLLQNIFPKFQQFLNVYVLRKNFNNNFASKRFVRELQKRYTDS